MATDQPERFTAVPVLDEFMDLLAQYHGHRVIDPARWDALKILFSKAVAQYVAAPPAAKTEVRHHEYADDAQTDTTAGRAGEPAAGP